MSTTDENATAESSAAPKTDKADQGKTRSETPYPYFGLSRAIEIIEAVRRAGGNEAPNTDVMREMGVAKVADRFWSYGIPAGIQFGLIERVARGDEGKIKITELGMRIALPGTPEEGRLARVAAFKKPELYSKLLEKFTGHPVPTKEGLKNILYRDYKIVESMAPIAADAFLDSLKVAALINGNNIIFGGDSAPAEEKPKSKLDGLPNGGEVDAATQTITVPEDFIIYRCKIGKGRVIEIPLPPEFTTAEVERLYAFLKTQVDEPEPLGKTEDQADK
jgi:hypothetical protein